MKRAFTLFPVLLIVFCFSQCLAQQTSLIKSAFKSFKNNPGLLNASIGFCMMDPENGKMLFEYNDSASLAPASCMKIVTTGAGLGILGENHRFRTLIGYTGSISDNGVLQGNLVLTGGGDPTFGSDRFADDNLKVTAFDVIIARVKKAGIKRITGSIVIDQSYFDAEHICPTWAWNDIGNYFGAGVYGLNFNENIYEIKLQADEDEGGSVAYKSTNPPNLGIHFTNNLKTGAPGSGDQSNIYGALTDSNRILEGTIPASKKPIKIKGSLPDPPSRFAKNMASKLFEADILSNRLDWEVWPAAGVKKVFPLDTILSPSLKDIVYYTNQNSINLYAECILKECGKTNKKPGTRVDGIAAIKKYYKDKGVELKDLFMEDGSGLSRYGAITALQLTKMLAVISKEKYFEIFLNSLPVSGKNSTMKRMGKGTDMDGKIYCKTGHMERVRAYAGYIKSPKGKWICFSLLVNNYALNAGQIYQEIEKLLEAAAKVED